MGAIDGIYQEYYRRVFWRNVPHEEAKKLLFQELCVFVGTPLDLFADDGIEDEIKKMVELEGYHFLGGMTQGFHGPYIWKDSTKVTYEVELPSGVEPYTVVMMDGFVSRSWMEFISFGITGTGGWAGKDGMLCCVQSEYDIESESFKISFLKHEAQHAHDLRHYKGIVSVDLEYRAKLVELIYWSGDQMVESILKQADVSDLSNGHGLAAYRIISQLSGKLFGVDYEERKEFWRGKTEHIRPAALELLEESDENLQRRPI